MILWFWLCEKISYLTTLLWYFIDHPSCHLHVYALAYGLVFMQRKSQSVVRYSKLNQSCEDPISQPDVGTQRTRWRVLIYFLDLFLFRKKKVHFNQVLYSPQKVSYADTI